VDSQSTHRPHLDTTSEAGHSITIGDRAATLRQLARETAFAGIGYVLLTGLAFSMLLAVWGSVYGRRWFVIVTTALAYLLWTLARRLGDNHPLHEKELYQKLGLANHSGLLRGVLLAWLAGFIFSPWPEGWLAWIPGVLYTAAILIDYVDGIIARVTRHTSVLGQALDTELDALGILVAPALGIWWGQLPIWYALVALAYYAFEFGKWLRTRQGSPLHPLPPSAIRRPMAGIQMGFISAILWPVLHPPLTTAAATLVMIPFVAVFLRDWFAVGGWIDPGTETYRLWMQRLSTIAHRWLPLLLRLLIVAVFVALISLAGQIALYQTLSPLNAVWILALSLLAIAGWLGRLAATLLAIFVSIAAARWGITPASAVLISCGLGLMLFGTGALSLWQPEDDFLQQRYGGRP
jgi:CDP-diacylglycerol--glycerol-3-phosphate 3-phosphatidyltransferase